MPSEVGAIDNGKSMEKILASLSEDEVPKSKGVHGNGRVRDNGNNKVEDGVASRIFVEETIRREGIKV